MEYVSLPARRFVILREAGGIGDVVRTFPVARGLKELHPGARVDYVCLAGYEGLVRLSPDVDGVFTVTERERRPRDAEPDPARFRYLRRVLDGTATAPNSDKQDGQDACRSRSCTSCESLLNDVAADVIDLYCPAYRHEVETGGAVTLDRVEIFCRAAGVGASTPRIVVPEGARRLARAKLRRFFGDAHGFATEVTEDTENGGDRGDGRKRPHVESYPSTRRASPSVNSVPSVAGRVVVGLAPYATHVSRSLPDAPQVIELAALLREAGARLVFFHSWKCARPGRDELLPAEIGAYPALKLPWPELAATVAACDLVVSVDTGILHLAGALGVPTVGLFGPTSGEVMCRPYPTHSWVSWGHDASSRLGGQGTGDAGRRFSAQPSCPHGLVGCAPPCYGRPERGYSKEVCGRVGCGVMRRLRPSRACAEAVRRRLRLSGPAHRIAPGEGTMPCPSFPCSTA